MENLGTERATISVSKKVFAAAKDYAEVNDLKFSTLAEKAIDKYLKAEGFVSEDDDARYRRIIDETKKNGITVDEFEIGVAEMLERKVCNA